MIVTCAEMKAIETRAFERGVEVEALMDEAGGQIARAILNFFPFPGVCHVVFGKGHNGGDALVAATRLAEEGWVISLEEVFPRQELAPLTRVKLEILATAHPFPEVSLAPPRPVPTIILDGLLGIGGKSGLREPIRSAAAGINALRRETGAAVFAIDIPTGLNGDSGEADPATVIADFTLTIGFAKRGLVADGSPHFTGRLAVLPLGPLSPLSPSSEQTATPHSLGGLLPLRSFETHKGDCGRVAIIAGSRCFTGAAVMAANAAVRAGAGLVSLFVTPDIYPVVASQAMPEVMTTPVSSHLEVMERPFDALAIGPGLGRGEPSDLLEIIERFRGPMVIDADALNLLASEANVEVLSRAAGPRLLTPHPGEMRRLFAESASLSRRETAVRFLDRFRDGQSTVTLLLKGSRTLIAENQPGGGVRLSYNTTGNPGMASGGMGDILTGTAAALAGQGLALFDAARVGAWVCGRAAELAVGGGHHSQESLSATDLPDFFGAAFGELRRPGYF